MLLTRAATSIGFFVLLLFGLYSPWPWTGHIIFVVGLAATILGTHEYYNLARRLKIRPSPWPGHAIALAFLVDGYVFHLKHFPHVLVTCFWLLLFTQVFFKKHDKSVSNMAVSLFGSIYIGLPMAILLMMFRYPDNWGFVQAISRNYPGRWGAPDALAGGNLMVFLIATSWMTDIGGYCFGKPFGRHKMTPVLSPNKSWEGMAGGVALAMVCGAGLRLFWPGMDAMFSWPEAIVLPAMFSLLGTVGDLAESAFKRDADIKDSGKTYTGHGGMLDIIDSLLLCAPVFWLYLERTRG